MHFTPFIISFISFPCAPAFILTAPPNVPGIPDNSSNPEISLFKNTLANLPIFSPAPAIISTFSFFSSISMPSMFIINVIPFIPSSETRILLPFPIIVNGILFCLAIFNISFNCSSLFIFIKHSAGPPILNVECLFIGSLNFISLSSIGKFDFFNISSMFKVSLPLLFFIILFFLYFFVIYFYKFSYLLYHFSQKITRSIAF